MKKYMMALDCGTTSVRCILFDKKGAVCSVAQKEFTQYFPKPGWVEQDADEIWSALLDVARESMGSIDARAADIAGIGITNQRETTIVWDKETGKPISRAIVWQCRRTADLCERLKQEGYADMIRNKTGLIPDAYFSATKIAWILEHVPGAAQMAADERLLFGTVETWVIWKLTKGEVHVTDCSNAARTMLFDIHRQCWDEEILSLLHIPSSMLPAPVSCSEIYGMSKADFFGAPIPISGAAGDQQAALFGQACFLKGQAKNTYGTGCFVLMNTGEVPVYSKNGLVTTIAWKIGDRVTYALEGSIFIGGALIQWLRDELRLLDSAQDAEYMAQKVADTNGCCIVPAFTGLGAPHWVPKARGTIFGLTRGVNKYHIIRAALEAIAFQVDDVLLAMQADAGTRLTGLMADGGASANNFLLQFQSDVSRMEVQRPDSVESTALGAAYLAGLAVGFWKDEEELLQNKVIDRRFMPSMEEETARRLRKRWEKAVGYARDCIL